MFADCGRFGKNPRMAQDGGFAQSVRELYPPTMRSLMRGAALSALSAGTTATGRMGRALARPRVQILLLHDVFPGEEGNFARLVKALGRDHAFITYGEAVRRAERGGGEIDQPCVVFSFDDGMRQNVRAGEILREHGAAACFFICPSIVGETDYAKVQRFCREPLEFPRSARPVEFMNWDEIERLKDMGHEIGGHTMTHPNLAQIPLAQASDEVGQCLEVIRSRLGQTEHFAWTYGRFHDCTPAVTRAIFQAGWRTCASGVRGAHGASRRTPEQPLCIRRDHIITNWPLSHVRYFMAQASETMDGHGGAWPDGWDIIGPSH